MKIRTLMISLAVVVMFILFPVQNAQAFEYQGYHWNGSGCPFSYANLPSSWQSAVQASATIWNNVPNANFTFYYSPYSDNFWSTWYIALGPVGSATTWVDGNNHIYMCVARFNTWYAWDTNGDPNKFDVQSVALHEFGHWLRLADENDEGDDVVMYGSIAAGEIKRYLHDDDEDGIQFIY